MRSNYKKLGQFIKEVSVKNKDLSVELLLGVSITKQFIPSIANTVGTDMSKYKVVEHHQFAYGPVTSRNGEKISVALLSEEKCIVSTSYTVFEIVDTELLAPEYLMMWFRRSEFDRYARYMSHGTVRELFGWQEMCDVELPVPSIEKQREIVREYNVVNDRIALNEQLTQKLEDTAQAIYKQWFVDFEFPISKEYAESIGKPELEGKPYKSSGGEMEYCDSLGADVPKGFSYQDLASIVDSQYGYTTSASFTEKNAKFLRITDISGDYIDWANVPYCDVNDSTIKKYQLKEGDVVVARTGATVGYAKRINKSSPLALFASYLVRLTPKDIQYQTLIGLSILSKDFLEYIQMVAGGTGQPQASATLMTEFKLLVPPPTVAALLDSKIKPMWDYSEKIEAEITLLNQLSFMCLMKLSR
ncbi:restriction endonuclease subunit S [Vibrio coralliilyticus]|uniref:restriction endonuclease subunit S n=1 Tax=Vibrio coralliilyticus TaxID=190893 RepID=UPI00148B55E4|nr:restriction endonuclease subunit S [Vibrio coralliilyticus]NOI18666.1 restriction endonuclease subunit S [Vibrio coralliilyticus]